MVEWVLCLVRASCAEAGRAHFVAGTLSSLHASWIALTPYTFGGDEEGEGRGSVAMESLPITPAGIASRLVFKQNSNAARQRGVNPVTPHVRPSHQIRKPAVFGPPRHCGRDSRR